MGRLEKSSSSAIFANVSDRPNMNLADVPEKTEEDLFRAIFQKTARDKLRKILQDPDSTDFEKEIAGQAYRQDVKELNYKTLFLSLTDGEVTPKSTGDGYNVKVMRQGNETRKDWSERTKDLAQTMAAVSSGEVSIDHKTFNDGRIIARVEPATSSDNLFKAALDI